MLINLYGIQKYVQSDFYEEAMYWKRKACAWERMQMCERMSEEIGYVCMYVGAYARERDEKE